MSLTCHRCSFYLHRIEQSSPKFLKMIYPRVRLLVSLIIVFTVFLVLISLILLTKTTRVEQLLQVITTTLTPTSGNRCDNTNNHHTQEAIPNRHRATIEINLTTSQLLTRFITTSILNYFTRVLQELKYPSLAFFLHNTTPPFSA